MLVNETIKPDVRELVHFYKKITLQIPLVCALL